MAKFRLLLVLSALTLTACGNPSSSSTTVAIDATFYYNCPGHEGEVYQNVSSDPTNPSYPMVPGYLFQGWYTAKEGGEAWDFTSSEKVPASLYAPDKSDRHAGSHKKNQHNQEVERIITAEHIDSQ